MSTMDPVVAGGVGGFGSTPFSVVSGSSTVTPDSPWLVMGEILLDSSFEYVAVRNVNFTDRSFEGRVLDWGRVSKTISPTSAGPQTSDAVFRMADTDQHWRDLSLTQSFRGRTVRLKLAKADETEPEFSPFWTGEIKETSFGPGWIQITARDNSWSWMDEQVPPLLTADNFPYILPAAEGAFAKIAFGDVNDLSMDRTAPSADKRGAVPLDHIGLVGGIDRWGAFRHTLYDIELYRRTSASPDSAAVDPAEYTVTVSNLIVDGYTYEMTFVDFLAVQDSGVVITANVKGLYFRPAVTGYPAVGYDPILNPGGDPGELHNPIDAFLNFMRLDCRKALLFDYDGIMAIRSTFESVSLVTGGTAPYDCSGVIDSSETRRAILSKFLPNFFLDMFHNRMGEVTLNFTQSNEEPKPLYSDRRDDGDRHLIIRDSFFENDPNPVANRCQLPALRHYANSTWLWTGSFDNFNDQALASLPQRDSGTDEIIEDGPRDPRIEPITAEFWFSRDSTTIYDVATRRMAFMALKSYQQTFDLPTPEVIEEVELCRLVDLTHRFGLSSGGYEGVEVKIFGISLDLRAFKTTLNTVRRVAETVLGSDVVVYGRVSLSGEASLIVDES